MRICGKTAILLVIFSAHVGAAAPAAKTKTKQAHTGASSMNSNDPVEKEKSDVGPFAPKGKTGELKKEEEKEERAAQVAEAPQEKPEPRDPIAVFGNVVIGFGHAPEPGPGTVSATGKAAGATFIVGGHYDVSPELTLGLRIPWAIASIRQVDGSNASTSALGSPELMGEYRVTLSPRTLLPIDFGLGVPVAQGDYDTVTGRDTYRHTQVNEFADASSGYRDPELFGPKRLPVIAGVGISYQKHELDLHAATKFVAGVKVGGQQQRQLDNTGTYALKPVTFRNVTSAGLAYRFLDKPMLTGALDSWIAYNAINAEEFTSTEGAAGPARIQVVFEPHLSARFGKISPSLGYIFPIGGRLADSSTSGLELHCDVAF
ncbi:MAG: hypothetical protein ABJB12_17130 [Pseudomonadota bacterium]